MATTVKHPYIGEFEKIQSIPKSQRAAYQRKINNMKVREGKPDISAFEQRFKNQGGFSYGSHLLHYHSIEQTASPTAIYVYIHGLNSHGGRVYYYARRVTELNPYVNFFAFDQMNFGQSEGDMRGFLHPIEEEVKQGEAFISFVLQKYANKPKVLLVGNSFGGPICVEMGVRNQCPIDGVILLTPALGQNQENLCLARKAVETLGYILPKITIPSRAGEGRSTKYDLAEEIRNDPHNFSCKIVPGSYLNLDRGIQQARKRFKKFTLPFITFMGGCEKVADLFGGVDFHEESPSADKTTICCPEMWHSALYEEQIEVIAQISASWVKQRL